MVSVAFPGQFDRVRSGADGDDAAGALQGCPGHSHEADGADTDHDDGVAELDAHPVHTREAGGDHVRDHHGLDIGDRVRDVRKVRVRAEGLDKLGERAAHCGVVGEVGAVGLVVLGLASLGSRVTPVGEACRDDDTVARFEVLHLLADLLEDADCLMADHLPDRGGQSRGLDQVDIGRACGNGRRADQGVIWADCRDGDVAPGRPAFAVQHITQHG